MGLMDLGDHYAKLDGKGVEGVVVMVGDFKDSDRVALQRAAEVLRLAIESELRITTPKENV